MKNNSLTLFIEINNSDFIFTVGENDENGDAKEIYNFKSPLLGFEHNRISDYEKIIKFLKRNIYLIEQKLNFTFKEVVLIIENFDLTFINLSGFKKLNGSQVMRENITYILNVLKSCLNKSEPKKTVLHIFNTKFNLDNKKIENLPIGLFGDFYSHELSFSLINSNDYKNLEKVFSNCNLKIKKILVKNFIKGVNIIRKNKDIETFFYINVNENNSKIFYFENNSFKFEQDFKFGTEIIIKDISKITSLKTTTVKRILEKIKFTDNHQDDELIEKEFFRNDKYRKIKKKLIFEIALARITELSEIILLKNINFKYYKNLSKNIYLEIYNKLQVPIFEKAFSIDQYFEIESFVKIHGEDILNTANKLVHFGWEKEAIPVLQTKKSILARFFDKLFT